ncbi:MAG: Rid family detoxifying hydrolase [Methylacidiphilales bacterium]|nr:Rid family detoxifying hydrolase [Candidatus Methylacidiphilales bacterium]
MIQEVKTSNAPRAIGSYSQAIRSGDLLFISGQIPLTPNGELKTGSIQDEIKQCFDNIKAIAESCGANLNQTVKYTVYLTNLGFFADVNQVSLSYFNEPFPARATVQISALPRDARVEIDAIVRINQSGTL